MVQPIGGVAIGLRGDSVRVLSQSILQRCAAIYQYSYHLRFTMKVILLASIAVSLVLAARETIQEAAVSARTLLYKENIFTLSSIFEANVNPTLAGQPFAYVLNIMLI